MTERDNNFIELVREASRMAVVEVMRIVEPSQDIISQNQAEKEFGAAWVRNHIASGKIATNRTGNAHNSKKQLSRSELVSLKSSERIHEIYIKTKSNTFN